MKKGTRNNRQSAIRNPQSALRALPSVDRVVWHPAMAEVRAQLPQAIVTAAARAEIEAARKAIMELSVTSDQLPDAEVPAAHSLSGHGSLVTGHSLEEIVGGTMRR